MLCFLTTYLKASERAARRKTGRYVLPKEDDPFSGDVQFDTGESRGVTAKLQRPIMEFLDRRMTK
jgi:hypothetical protein